MNNNFFQEILVKNPVLVGTIGLCPVVAICTSLKAALIMSAITIVTLIVAQLITSLLLKYLPQWVRLGLYTVVGMIVVVPAMIIVDKMSPETMIALGIYLPLLAVNPLVVRNCEREAVDATLGQSIFTSFCAGLGYSVVLIIVGLVREIVGAGEIWGHRIPFIHPAEAFMMPMGGFVLIAFLAAALRVYFRKIDPKFADELIENSRTNIKGSNKAKLALRGAKYADGSTVAPRQKRQKKVKEKKERPAKVRKAPVTPEEPIEVPKEKPAFEVMTLEQAEELRSANLPPVETTVQSELAPPTAEDPVINEPEAPVSQKTSRFEFVTLDLSTTTKEREDAERFAAAVAATKEQKPQRQILNRRGQEKQTRPTTEEVVEETKEGEDE